MNQVLVSPDKQTNDEFVQFQSECRMTGEYKVPAESTIE